MRTFWFISMLIHGSISLCYFKHVLPLTTKIFTKILWLCVGGLATLVFLDYNAALVYCPRNTTFDPRVTVPASGPAGAILFGLFSRVLVKGVRLKNHKLNSQGPLTLSGVIHWLLLEP